MKMFALLDAQGTACAETSLCQQHYDDAGNRVYVETQMIPTWLGDDKAIAGTWTDCTGNEMLECLVCGHKEVIIHS